MTLLLVGAVLCLVGGVSLYVSSAVVDTDAFSDRAVKALHDDEVRRVVAREISRQLAARGHLGSTSRELEGAVELGMRSRAFERSFRAAAAETHGVLFAQHGQSVVFDVSDAGSALVPTLRRVAPRLAEQIPTETEARILEFQEHSIGVRALRLVNDTGAFGAVLALAGLAALIAGVAIAPDRRVALTRAGLAVGGAGAFLLAALLVFQELVVSGARGGFALSRDDVGPAVKGVWTAYAGDLTWWALGVAALGLAVAAVAARSARSTGRTRAI